MTDDRKEFLQSDHDENHPCMHCSFCYRHNGKNAHQCGCPISKVLCETCRAYEGFTHKVVEALDDCGDLKRYIVPDGLYNYPEPFRSRLLAAGGMEAARVLTYESKTKVQLEREAALNFRPYDKVDPIMMRNRRESMERVKPQPEPPPLLDLTKPTDATEWIPGMRIEDDLNHPCCQCRWCYRCKVPLGIGRKCAHNKSIYTCVLHCIYDKERAPVVVVTSRVEKAKHFVVLSSEHLPAEVMEDWLMGDLIDDPLAQQTWKFTSNKMVDPDMYEESGLLQDEEGWDIEPEATTATEVEAVIAQTSCEGFCTVM